MSSSPTIVDQPQGSAGFGPAPHPRPSNPSRLAEGALQALAVQAREGDAQAAEELARQLQPMAFRWALRILRDLDDAEEVSQDALLRCFERLERYEASRPLIPWFHRIVRNRAIDRLRRRRRRTSRELQVGDTGGLALFDVADGRADRVDRRIDRERQRLRLRTAIALLPPHYRHVVLLREYGELSYREVAATLRIPIGTVMSRLHVARHRLRWLVTTQSASGAGPNRSGVKVQAIAGAALAAAKRAETQGEGYESRI